MQGTGRRLPPRASLPTGRRPRASSTTCLHHGPHHPAVHHELLPRRRTWGARSQSPCPNPARVHATSNANGANHYQHQLHGLPPDHSQYQRSPSEPKNREAFCFRQRGLLDPKPFRIGAHVVAHKSCHFLHMRSASMCTYVRTWLIARSFGIQKYEDASHA